MDLFDYMRETTKEKESPLASRLRPTTLDEVVGQQHIIGKDKLLYRAIKADKLGSVIFYPLVPRPVIFRGENGDGQSLIIRLVDPQDMLAGVRTQRAIRYGHHHDRKRIPEQAHRRGLAVRERTTQLIGRTLEGDPVRPRTIQVHGGMVRTLAPHDLAQMVVQQRHQTNAGRKGRHQI